MRLQAEAEAGNILADAKAHAAALLTGRRGAVSGWRWGVRERKRYTPKRTDVGVTLNCTVGLHVTRAATMGVFLECYMCVFACVLYGI